MLDDLDLFVLVVDAGVGIVLHQLDEAAFLQGLNHQQDILFSPTIVPEKVITNFLKMFLNFFE